MVIDDLQWADAGAARLPRLDPRLVVGPSHLRPDPGPARAGRAPTRLGPAPQRHQHRPRPPRRHVDAPAPRRPRRPPRRRGRAHRRPGRGHPALRRRDRPIARRPRPGAGRRPRARASWARSTTSRSPPPSPPSWWPGSTASLPEERTLVRDLAVLGTSFPRAAIDAVAQPSGAQLDDLLASLVRREVLNVIGDPLSPERGQLQFAQGLMRTVVYDNLTRRRAQAPPHRRRRPPPGRVPRRRCRGGRGDRRPPPARRSTPTRTPPTPTSCAVGRPRPTSGPAIAPPPSAHPRRPRRPTSRRWTSSTIRGSTPSSCSGPGRRQPCPGWSRRASGSSTRPPLSSGPSGARARRS